MSWRIDSFIRHLLSLVNRKANAGGKALHKTITNPKPLLLAHGRGWWFVSNQDRRRAFGTIQRLALSVIFGPSDFGFKPFGVVVWLAVERLHVHTSWITRSTTRTTLRAPMKSELPTADSFLSRVGSSGTLFGALPGRCAFRRIVGVLLDVGLKRGVVLLKLIHLGS